MKKYLFGCLAALATLMFSCSENVPNPVPVAAEVDPFVSAYGMKTPVPMRRSEVLKKVLSKEIAQYPTQAAKASANARVSGYVGNSHVLYMNKTWRLAEYEVNQAWIDKYGHPHAASSCWVNSTLNFFHLTDQDFPSGQLLVTNVCGRANAGDLYNGGINNDLRYLSEQNPSVMTGTSNWSVFAHNTPPGVVTVYAKEGESPVPLGRG